jgi:hypothetical protein
MKRATTGDGKKFKRIIKAGRVASAWLNDRVKKREISGVEARMR